MTRQNIYDNNEFYDGYQKIRVKEANANDLIIAPITDALIGKTNYRTALDLGCGTGKLSYQLSRNGVKVDSIDISAKMINKAREEFYHENITYINKALEDYLYPENKYDLVVSTMAFHYIACTDLENIFAKINNSLKNDGIFIFSVEHPSSRASKHQGWLSVDNKKLWPLADYFDRGLREEEWLVSGVIKYHRTVSDYFNLLKNNSFSLIDLNEAEPNNMALEKLPRAEIRPLFLFMKAVKK